MRIRRADSADLPGVMNVLDGANLAVDVETVARRIETEHVIVAERGAINGVLQAVPRREGVHVEALAVRRRRRRQGVGTELLDAAYGQWGRVTVSCDRELMAFYRSGGFDVRSQGSRCFGERT